MTATIATAPYLQPLIPLALATAYDPTAGECDIDAAARLLAETDPRIAWQMSEPDSPLWDNAIALAAMVEEAADAITSTCHRTEPTH